MRIGAILALALTVLAILAWMLFTMAVILRGPKRRCPKCDGNRTRASLSRAMDHLLPAFIAPRRCETCNARFHRLQSVDYRCRPASARDSSPRSPADIHYNI